MIKRILAFACIAAVALAAAGCNTIEGAGKDIKAAGGGIEKAASKNKSY